MTICITLPSLAVFGKPFLEYEDLAIFQNGGRRHLVLLNCRNFNDRKGQQGQRALVYKISCSSVKRMLRYGDFSIFQDGGRRHLGFLNF